MEKFRAFPIALCAIGSYFLGGVLGKMDSLASTVGGYLVLISICLSIAAIVKGKKELRYDPGNKKSKIGFILGIIVTSIHLFINFIYILLII
ncbi:MAG: hypothetical protein HY818_17670 [Acetobacterium woodii]|nr:hypothetical protein [Acetobacterium woodii]